MCSGAEYSLCQWWCGLRSLDGLLGFISKCGSGTVPNAAACQSQSADYVAVRALGWVVVADVLTELCIEKEDS